MTDRANRTGLYEMPTEPELPDLFRVALREMMLQFAAHSVARVIATDAQPLGYDPATQKCSVQVEVLQVIKDHFTTATASDPNPSKIRPPVVLKNIKVDIAGNTTTAYLSFPIVIGTTGTLHVQDRSIQQWNKTGVASDPVSAFIHMLGDSTFHPGLRPDTNPIAPPTSQVAAVLEGPLVFLGALATEPLLKGITLSAAFTAYTAAVAAAGAAHAAIIPPTAISNAAFITALTAATAVLSTSIATWVSLKSFTE